MYRMNVLYKKQIQIRASICFTYIGTLLTDAYLNNINQ